MEKGKKLLSAAVKSVVSWAGKLGRTAAQLAAKAAGSVTRFLGRKTADLARAHRQPLLLAGAIVSAVLAVAAGALWLLGRKK